MAKRTAGRDGRRMAAGRDGKGCLPVAAGDGGMRPLKTSETIARDVVHDIVERGLGTGDGLPHEAAMLELYGVSRESLREGLRLLEVQGLITIRRGPGGGPSVGEVSPANLGRTASLYFHLVGATNAELLDAWVLAEGTLTELAARQPDRERVRRALGPHLVGVPGGDDDQLEEYVRSRIQFHAVVASLADNRPLELMLQSFGQIVTHQFMGVADPRELHEAVDDDHTELARAIVAGHAKRARALMEAHIRYVADFYAARLGARVHDFVEWR
jgi:GntR family transcriptional regulator, transcriptional repressor for pyruvate dehydrogenase complex